MSVIMYILFIFVAFLILLFMITIHEFGHYTAGKLLKFKINEFSIGMGPKIFSRKRKGGEVFSLRAIPLGGFCAFEGEDKEENSPGAFNNQKPWKRIIVLFSGAFFNIVSAVIIVLIAFLSFGDALPVIERFYETHPSYQHSLDGKGLMPGDAVYSVNGKILYFAADFSPTVEAAPEVMDMVVYRNGKKVTLYGIKKGDYVVEIFKTDQDGNILRDENGKPEYVQKVDERGDLIFDENGNPVFETEKRFGVGALISIPHRTRLTTKDSFSRCLPYCGNAGLVVLKALGRIVTGDFTDVLGPVGTIKLTGEIAATGFASILFLITLISINLAVFNLLPVPALDGSRILFTVIEWIFGKPVVSRNVEGLIHFIGLVALLLSVIAVDIFNFVF